MTFELKISSNPIPKTVLSQVVKAMELNAVIAERTSKTKYLTGPRPGKLGVVTGRLRNSITTEVNTKGNTVSGVIGTNVIYGPIHELGGVINARSKLLTFKINNIWVRTKKVTIPARPFLYPSLVDNVDIFRDNVDKAIMDAI